MFYLDLFQCLQTHDVRYVLAGGLAMNLHGVPRMTMVGARTRTTSSIYCASGVKMPETRERQERLRRGETITGD